MFRIIEHSFMSFKKHMCTTLFCANKDSKFFVITIHLAAKKVNNIVKIKTVDTYLKALVGNKDVI